MYTIINIFISKAKACNSAKSEALNARAFSALLYLLLLQIYQNRSLHSISSFQRFFCKVLQIKNYFRSVSRSVNGHRIEKFLFENKKVSFEFFRIFLKWSKNSLFFRVQKYFFRVSDNIFNNKISVRLKTISCF